MDLQTFLDLSGITLTQAQEDRYERVARRAELNLTRLLGWSATQRNLFEEAGKTNAECQCVDQTMNDDAYEKFIEGLQEPDEEEGIIRLFPYNSKDSRLFIDPASAIYKVKLVQFTRGSDQQFVTLRTFKDWMPLYSHNATVDESARTYAHYIELCKADFNSPCGCTANCTNCGYLAVDGDWVRNSYPDDLQDLLMQLILQEYQNPLSLNRDQNRIVTSESVSNHSVSYLITDREKKGSTTRVQDEEWFIEEVKKWIGPYSPLAIRVHVL